MTNDSKKPPVLLCDPDQAIDSYLRSLLSEVDEYQAPEPEAPKKVAEIVDIRPSLKRFTPNPSEKLSAADTLIEPAPTIEEPTSGQIIPDWANESFQCLLFKLRGITMAIPLKGLNGIAEWTQDVTVLPGQPDWYMGLILHRDSRVIVVDTAKLIMPERLQNAPDRGERGSHILIIGDGRWGLACDSLLSPVTLQAGDVRWRTGIGVRPWLAGTLVDKLCVLLDIDALLKMIGHK